MGATDYAAIERRIEWFIGGLGVAGAIGAGVGWGIRAAEGVAAGAALCLFNFRWLRQGATGVMRLGMAQAGTEKVEVPKSLHVKFLGRIVLLVVAVYAILVWLHLPAIAVLCGLAVILPAILFELGVELMQGNHRSDGA
jgi:hypothetical protein